MQYDEKWQERYKDMLATPQQALARLRPGQRVFVGGGCAEPAALVRAMVARAGELADVEIVQLLTKGEAPYADRKYAGVFAVNSFFIGENVRETIREGQGSYTPILLSDVPNLFHSGQLPLDMALIQVTEPNERGKVSLGISVDVVKSAAQNASLVIAQVNPRMPWTQGDSLLDVGDLDLLVPLEEELVERLNHPSHETSRQIGRYVAGLVPNGATIEFGLGRVPGVGRVSHAVLEFLQDKKDLGIHTEMLTDGVLDLIEAGVVTGARKTTDRGKVVASFCMGTRRLYDAIHDNPLFAFRPTEYVNDSGVIARQHAMVSITMAMEVDLTGQVSADSAEGRFYSGIGGQVDFNRGAARSPGGRAIIVLPSTDTEGKHSRIVTRLSPGAGVTVSRGTVRYLVTEYGVAYLHGKSIQERALALISISHPDMRERLFHEAVEAHYIRPEMARVEGRISVAGGEELKATKLLDDGTQVSIRSVHPTDEPLMRDLLYTLSQETLYYRFMSHSQRFTAQQVQDFVYIDHRKDVAVVATVPEAHGEDIVAVGRYFLDAPSNRAEVAFVVRDQWQNRRLGTFLFRHLAAIAKRNGIAGFTAEVLRDNRRMQAIFTHSGFKLKSRLEEDVYSFVMDF